MGGCNHTSVGVLVEREGKVLLIERKKFPFGWAPPAGHIDDGEDYETAARRELKEEVGLIAGPLELLAEGRKEYQCSRGSTWHYWKLYKTSAEGELRVDTGEAKNFAWFAPGEIKNLKLDPVIGEWFKELGII